MLVAWILKLDSKRAQQIVPLSCIHGLSLICAVVRSTSCNPMT